MQMTPASTWRASWNLLQLNESKWKIVLFLLLTKAVFPVILRSLYNPLLHTAETNNIVLMFLA